LINLPLGEKVLATFKLSITRDDEKRLHSKLSAHDEERRALKSHEQMWRKVDELESAGRLEYQACEANSDDEDVGVSAGHFDLAALKLAKELQVSLLADDRVIQSLALAEGRGDAYGTDALLMAMLKQDSENIEKLCESFLYLMRWRYRFILIPPRILYEYAKSSLGSLPGDELVEVAYYIQQCMCDPGLHCGLENSEPPLPLAAKLAIGWAAHIVDFLVLIWEDESFSDDDAFVLTRWAVEDMLPSVPRGLAYSSIGFNMAHTEEQSIMHLAMMHFSMIPNVDRANLGLQTLAQAFGLSEDEFLSSAVEATRVTRQ